jgi:tRNA threonylcarbamoyladenosine biosynthesis protein TsaE
MDADAPPFEIENEEEATTVALARALGPLLLGGDLLVLSGGLGAGKTFFTRALCHALGLPEDEPVTSPTFTLVHEYPTDPPLVHADLYRLSGEDEVFELGLDARRQESQLLVVEWGAPFEATLGGGGIFLEFDLEPRRARLGGASERARQVVRCLTKLGLESRP